MNIFHRFAEFVDPFLSMAVSSPRKWMCFLVFLGCGWIFATAFTVLGMCMVSCRRMNHGRKNEDNSYICELSRDKDLTHAILMISGAVNGLLVFILVFAIVYRKVAYVTREYPPPDYDTLIKSETPPPTYNELAFDNPLMSLPEACFVDSEGLVTGAGRGENPDDKIPPFVLIPVHPNHSSDLNPSDAVRSADMPPPYDAIPSTASVPVNTFPQPVSAPTEITPSSADVDSTPPPVFGLISTPGFQSVSSDSVVPGSSSKDDQGAEAVISTVLPVKS